MVHLLLLVLGACLGAAAGKFLRLPMWPLTGAMLGAGTVQVLLPSPEQLPPALGFTAQVLMGTVVGASIIPGSGKELRAIIVPGTIVVAAILVVGVGAGLVTAQIGGYDPVLTTFGMVPGGVGEMVAAAIALEVDSAVVAGMHIGRLVIVLSALPLLLRIANRWGRSAGPDADTADE